MTLRKSILLTPIFLVGSTLGLHAQPQYLPYPQAVPNPQYPYYQPFPSQPAPLAPARPPSWYYNPYTSGLTPCSHPEVGKCGPKN